MARAPHRLIAPGRLTPSVLRQMRATRLVVLDVDGVLTDGALPYLMGGEDIKASRFFSVKDGLAIAQGALVGLPTAIITSKVGAAVRKRCEDLRIEHLIVGREDKRAALAELSEVSGVPTSAMAFMGDDLLDLGALNEAGLAMAPSDAAPEVLRAAHYITGAPGGRGCVREAIRAILMAQHRWQDIVDRLASR